MIILHETGLRRILKSYFEYYQVLFRVKQCCSEATNA